MKVNILFLGTRITNNDLINNQKDFVNNYAPFHSYKIELLNDRTQVCFVNLDIRDIKKIRVSLNFQETTSKGIKNIMKYGQKLFDFSLEIEEVMREINKKILKIHNVISSSRFYLILGFYFKMICFGLYLAFSLLYITRLYTNHSTNKEMI